MGTTMLKTRCFESKRIFAPFALDKTSSAARISEKPRAAVSLVGASVEERSDKSWERIDDVDGARRRARAFASQNKVFMWLGGMPLLMLEGEEGKFKVKNSVAWGRREVGRNLLMRSAMWRWMESWMAASSACPSADGDSASWTKSLSKEIVSSGLVVE